MRKPPHATSFQILDADGGWLTTEGIALAGSLNPETVDRCLYRWRLNGFVESRHIGLSLDRRGARPAKTETRMEWRTL